MVAIIINFGKRFFLGVWRLRKARVKKTNMKNNKKSMENASLKKDFSVNWAKLDVIPSVGINLVPDGIKLKSWLGKNNWKNWDILLEKGRNNPGPISPKIKKFLINQGTKIIVQVTNNIREPLKSFFSKRRKR